MNSFCGCIRHFCSAPASSAKLPLPPRPCGCFLPSVFIGKTFRNRNSVKIVLDFTCVSRLLGNNSTIPFLTAAKKRQSFLLPRRFVDASSISLAPPQATGLVHFAASPLSTEPSALGFGRIFMPHIGAASGFGDFQWVSRSSAGAPSESVGR